MNLEFCCSDFMYELNGYKFELHAFYSDGKWSQEGLRFKDYPYREVNKCPFCGSDINIKIRESRNDQS